MLLVPRGHYGLFGATGATGLNVQVQHGVKGLVEMNEGCQEGLKILREQIDAGEWYGGTPKKLNDDFAYSVGEACIALATFGGWVVLSRRDLLDLVVAMLKEDGKA